MVREVREANPNGVSDDANLRLKQSHYLHITSNRSFAL